MKILDMIGSHLKVFWSLKYYWFCGREKINRNYGGSEASHIFAVVSGSDLYFDLLYSDFIKEQ